MLATQTDRRLDLDALRESRSSAAPAILVLTAINHFGLKQGAAVQNLMTVLKIGAILAVAVLGFLVPAKSALGITAPLPPRAACSRPSASP